MVLANRQPPKLIEYIEAKLEGWLRLEINRSKTRVRDLRQPGESLDFLGIDVSNRSRQLWERSKIFKRDSVEGSAETGQAEGADGKPSRLEAIPTLVQELNRQLKGWAQYFGFGYPQRAFRQIDWYVQCRLRQRVRRRSQRPFRKPKGETWDYYFQTLGVVQLAKRKSAQLPAHA